MISINFVTLVFYSQELVRQTKHESARQIILDFVVHRRCALNLTHFGRIKHMYMVDDRFLFSLITILIDSHPCFVNQRYFRTTCLRFRCFMRTTQRVFDEDDSEPWYRLFELNMIKILKCFVKKHLLIPSNYTFWVFCILTCPSVD